MKPQMWPAAQWMLAAMNDDVTAFRCSAFGVYGVSTDYF